MAVGVMAPDVVTVGAGARPWQVFVRMKIAMLRHGLRDQNRVFFMVVGGVIGLGLAAGTVWAGAADADLLAVALGLWMLGWVVGPLFTGGGDESLRPEFFTALPLSRRALTGGLVAASFVGVAPVIALVALSSVIVQGARISVPAALVGVPAVLLELACFVLASRLAVAVYGLLLQVRSGAVLAGAVNAFILAFTAQGWALVVAFVSFDVKGVLATAGRIAPSGWALVAVEAAGRGDWLLVLAALAGLGVLAAVLFLGWSALLAWRGTADRIGVTPRYPLTARSAQGAAGAKELRTWSRDLLSGHRVVFSLVYGLAFCLMPLAIGWTGMVPFAGLVGAVMGGAMSSNLYAADGTALWLTLMVPGSARIDLRSRQRAFLLVYGPPVVLISLLATWWGDATAWPLVLAVLPAVLGGAAGISALLSVVMAVPGVDAHQRSGNPLSSGDNDGEAMGQVYAGLALILLTTGPAVGAALWWGWWGVPVGVATGLLSWWGLGAIAISRLERRGPELLSLLRHGRPADGPGGAAVGSLAARMEALPFWRRVLVWLCVSFGAIPLFPQGVVPMIFKFSGVETKSWFLAMHVPDAWSWPVIVAMIALGLAMYATVASVFWAPAAPQPAE
ncbi:hypothetical protein [Pseudonocardia sp. GCM10023141]|uniref:hypothetical protein n=1 Tax=Pseudonocardia sp. GCM10023141 TaxID=3252653 RepID=UPI0036189FDB